jgi:predicted O-methyltransferase YrrM
MVNVPCPVLQEIYTTRKIRDDSGEVRDLHDEIPNTYAEALYRTVLARKPAAILEIGLAYGLSALAMVRGLRDAGGTGKLISLDPGQTQRYNRIGRLNVERAGYGHNHEVIEDFDYFALPMILRRGQKIDFAYIDGWHTFDYCLLDFFYCDKLLNPGGVVAFNDAGYRAVHKVIQFLKTHRRYREINVGLPADYRGRNLLFTGARWLSGMPTQDRYFEKLEDWEPDWHFYKSF